MAKKLQESEREINDLRAEIAKFKKMTIAGRLSIRATPKSSSDDISFQFNFHPIDAINTSDEVNNSRVI